jgi:hypothetical protein
VDELKFELSVLFTKNEELNPLSGNDRIKSEYEKMFRKEVLEDDLARVIEEIIRDQELFGHIETPEDFELL